MKKYTLLFLALFATFTMMSQEFGTRLGVDFASARVEIAGDSNTETGTGFYLGIFGSFDISDKFAIRPEVNYSNVDVEDTPFDQISVPILAQFATSDSFRILVGPSFGFLLDTDEGVDTFNFGFDFGLAYNFNEKFALEGRYNLGLSNLIDDEPDLVNVLDVETKLSGFVFGLAYTFN